MTMVSVATENPISRSVFVPFHWPADNFQNYMKKNRIQSFDYYGPPPSCVGRREEKISAIDMGDYFRIPSEESDLNYAKYFNSGNRATEITKIYFKQYAPVNLR
jgi:hypothetical protein